MASAPVSVSDRGSAAGWSVPGGCRGCAALRRDDGMAGVRMALSCCQRGGCFFYRLSVDDTVLQQKSDKVNITPYRNLYTFQCIRDVARNSSGSVLQ